MIDSDEQFISKLQDTCASYIKANIYADGWKKGKIHSQICKLICEYLTKEQYSANMMVLRQKIHKITTEMTDRLDKSAGLPVIGFRLVEIPDQEIEKCAIRLSISLFQSVKNYTDLPERRKELMNLVIKHD